MSFVVHRRGFFYLFLGNWQIERFRSWGKRCFRSCMHLDLGPEFTSYFHIFHTRLSMHAIVGPFIDSPSAWFTVSHFFRI